MGVSKALMEKTAQALGRNHPESPTTVSVTRAAAVVGPLLTFNAHVINTGTNSYRLRTTREQRP